MSHRACGFLEDCPGLSVSRQSGEMVLSLLLLLVATAAAVWTKHFAVSDLYPPYKKYSRWRLFSEQICLSIACIFSLSSCVESDRSVIGTILKDVALLTALLVSLKCDSVHNLPYAYHNLPYWFAVHAVFASLVLTSAISGGGLSISAAVFAIFGLFFSLWHWLCPYEFVQINKPNTEDTCELFEFIFFQYLNPFINEAQKETIELKHVPTLSDNDSTAIIWPRFQALWEDMGKDTPLSMVLLRLIRTPWTQQAALQLIGTLAMFCSPIGLQRVLGYAAEKQGHSGVTQGDSIFSVVPIKLALILLFLGPTLAGLCDGQNYIRGRHCGLRIRGALMALLIDKSAKVDLNSCDTDMGRINNLISVDIDAINDFICYSHFLWACPLTILLAMSMMFAVLGWAALAGMAVMVGTLTITFLLCDKLDSISETILLRKDARMAIVGELLKAIATVKQFAWEYPFMERLRIARKIEMSSIKEYQVLNVIFNTLLGGTTVASTLSAMLFHTLVLRQPLSPATGFTILTLFSFVRMPLEIFPDMIAYAIQAQVSLRRIEAFVRTPDVIGRDNSHTDMGVCGDNDCSNSNTMSSKSLESIKLPSHSPIPPNSNQKSNRVYANNENGSASGSTNGVPVIEVCGVTMGWSNELEKIWYKQEGLYSDSDSDDDNDNELDSPPGWTAWAVDSIDNCWGGKSGSRSKSGGGSSGRYQALNTGDIGTDTIAEDDIEMVSTLERTTSDSSSVYSVEDMQASVSKTTSESYTTSNQLHTMGTISGADQNASSSSSSSSSSSREESNTSSSSSSVNVHVVLRDVNMRIHAGSFALIVGATGTGKSTLLAALLGECSRLVSRSYKDSTTDSIGSSSSGSMPQHTFSSGIHTSDMTPLPPNSHMCCIRGDVCYAGQISWIQNATVRDNIVFGCTWNPSLFAEVIRCCALETDISMMEAGIWTELGEQGVNLSGGQKQRVSLARAAYAAASNPRAVLVLDDVLSALDAPTSRYVVKELLLGLLKGRTRVLVTHLEALARRGADQIYRVVDGMVHCERDCVTPAVEYDLSPTSPIDPFTLTATSIALSTGINAGSDKDIVSVQKSKTLDPHDSHMNGQKCASTSVSMNPILVNIDLSSPVNEDANQNHDNTHDNDEIYNNNKIDMKVNVNSSYKSNVMSVKKSNSKYYHSTSGDENIYDEHAGNKCYDEKYDGSNITSQKSGRLVTEETKDKGTVALSVYMRYVYAAGGILSFAMILTATCGVEWLWWLWSRWLGNWLHSMNGTGSAVEIPVAVVFITFAIPTCVCLREILCALGLLRASQNLHDNCMLSIVRAPLSWFESTPIGRVINRLSSDVSTIDKQVMESIRQYMECLFAATAIVLVIAVEVPLLIILLIPVCIFTYHLSMKYVIVSRDCKRVQSVAQSPVFVLFGEMIAGRVTVRAFGVQQRFFERCYPLVDAYNRAYIALWISNRWLQSRMVVVGALMSGAIGVAVVYSPHSIGDVAAGLALSYCLEFTDTLTWLVRSHAQCQMNFNAIERVGEYSDIMPEAYGTDGGLDVQDNGDQNNYDNQSNTWKAALIPRDILRGVPTDWPRPPSQGGNGIEFIDIHMKYKSRSDPVLRGVYFKVTPGSSLAIVGRTGAGKSSLLAALLRLEEPYQGKILLDDVNALALPLHTLRSSIAMVPQNPTLFKGSVRSNLDPFNMIKDDKILWLALKRCNIVEHIKKLGGESLEEKMVTEGGENFSVGQRQLLCMARALLRQSPFLVLDECSSACDDETDDAIQKAVREAFADSTVITIAHRLKTIMHYDQIVVMDQGSVLEQGSPLELLRTPSSRLLYMCERSGKMDELLNLATQAYVARRDRAVSRTENGSQNITKN